MSTDRDWRKWGSDNPYFGVLSDPKYLGSQLDSEEISREFFQSGAGDIVRVMERVKRLGGEAPLKHAVDFGCGVGRLTIPLAAYAAKVTGLDVSASVLAEARKQTPRKLARRIDYQLSDAALTNLPSRYDLVHSFIVLQHIPPARGKVLIRQLLDGLASGGFAALHVTYAHRAPQFQKLVIMLRNHFVPLHDLLNVLKGRPLRTPRMRMHCYDLGQVIDIFSQAGMTETVCLATDHGGYLGVMLIGKKA